MPLRVICRAQYLSRPVEGMRKEDYDATHLVKAVKGRELDGRAYTRVTIGGQSVKITEANKHRAIDWFAEWAALKVDALGLAVPILLPIPSSKTVAASPRGFRTDLIAQAIAAKCQRTPQVVPILRWDQQMTPSSEGGPRDPVTLHEHYIFVAAPPAGQYVLIDDVYTGGGHLIAAAWSLQDHQQGTDVAICCGRTCHDQLNDPFTVDEEILDLRRPPGV